jgi:hypothetical protein
MKEKLSSYTKIIGESKMTFVNINAYKIHLLQKGEIKVEEQMEEEVPQTEPKAEEELPF